MAFGYPQINPYQQYSQAGQARAVEVIPVDNEEQINSWQIPFGSTVEFVARDDSFVIFKSVEMNGQTTITAYDRRGRSPTTGRYVSRDGGYSGHDGIEDILEDVRDMPESERRKLKQMLERM